MNCGELNLQDITNIDKEQFLCVLMQLKSVFHGSYTPQCFLWTTLKMVKPMNVIQSITNKLLVVEDEGEV